MGWHLTGGRAVLEAGARTYPDPVTVDATKEFANNAWLFDVVAYALWSVTPALLPVLAGLCMTATVLVVWRIAVDAGGDTWRAVTVAAMASGVASIRFFPRPQLFFLLCLALCIWTTRRRWYAATCVVVAIWAQSHLSVFIAPFVVAGSWRERPSWWFGVVCLLPFTGAEGFGIVEQVFGYTGGDAAATIEDVGPMQWEWLIPPDGPEIVLFEVLLVLGVIGSWRERRLPLLPVCQALLGVVLMMKTHRFVSAAAILAVPWVAEVWRGPDRRSIAAAACAAGLYTAAVGWTPGVGPDRREIPVDLLDAIDVTGNGYTDYDIGGWVGFTRYGEARVYIDARTLVFHEDSRFFAQRAALADPGTFAMLHAAHGFDWAIVPRTSALCRALDWSPVWLDDERAVFVRAADPRRLRAIDPCLSDAELVAACRAAPGAHRTDIETVSGRWARGMAVEFYASCGEPEAASAFRHLEGLDDGWRGGLAFLAADDPAGAITWLETSDDVRADATRAQLLLEAGRAEEARDVAAALVSKMVDASPDELRFVLAQACLETGDPRCTAEQALRAALRGHRPSADLLADPAVAATLTEDERRLAAAARGR